MNTNERPRSIINTLGEEIIRIITPVSICMFLVVLLVSTLNPNPNSQTISTIANMVYDETSSDSFWAKFEGALLNSLVFVAVITVVTFFLVFLFYIRCTKFLKIYMGFSAFMVLGFMGGQIGFLLLEKFSLPFDVVSFFVVLVNFSVVGVLAVFMSNVAILVTQGYMVVIGMLVAFWFTMLPEWTTWMVLVALAVYDFAAVLLPVGPLRLLVELAVSRDEDIPALVYEARPVGVDESRGEGGRRRWRERESDGSNLVPPMVSSVDNERDLGNAEEGRGGSDDREISRPLLEQRVNDEQQVQEITVSDESMAFEGIGLGSSGAIKLGLGDFIFYSVLVGRAAMYDYMTVYACYLAIIAGLGITLMLLAVYQKALPALPVSIMLGVMFYVLTRALLEEFVVQCSINFLMF